MKKVFITGSSGFVGKHLINELKKKNIDFIAGTRILYGDFSTQDKWEEKINECQAIVHLAARVHVMEENETDPLTAFRRMNVEATMKLACAAKKVGVKRFIFVSSVKVNGEETHEVPFSANDKAQPQDFYGISKKEAEESLMTLHEPGKFEVVIIRPPLIYGPGVKANFEKLFWLVKKDLPLPFGRVRNKRSIVSVFNLSSLIIQCLDHPNASGEIFLVSDDHDYSLREMLELIGKVEGKHPHLLPIPVSAMKFVATILGKKSYADRLFGNLHVDIDKTKKMLEWHPPVSFIDTFKN